jgi:hypothetical protein
VKGAKFLEAKQEEAAEAQAFCDGVVMMMQLKKHWQRQPNSVSGAGVALQKWQRRDWRSSCSNVAMQTRDSSNLQM